MKGNWILWGLTGLCVVVLSAWTVFNEDAVRLSDEEADIRIRKMGHELLLLSGDSTSRVLPVRKMDEGTYRLEFSSPFELTPESLVHLAKQNLGVDRWQSYRITVHDCDAGATVYGFQQSLLNDMTVVPCLGRIYPKQCYAIQVALTDEEQKAFGRGSFAWLSLAFGSFCVVAFVMFRKKTNATTDGQPMGNYRFISEKRMIISTEGVVDLTDKETQVLDILLKHKNDLVKRDHLMREVWNDHGVLESRSLDVFISRLRKKLAGDNSIEIVNTHGVGYTLLIRSS
jgi:hypothetical protein